MGIRVLASRAQKSQFSLKTINSENFYQLVSQFLADPEKITTFEKKLWRQRTVLCTWCKTLVSAEISIQLSAAAQTAKNAKLSLRPKSHIPEEHS